MSNGSAAVLGCAKRIEDAERPSSSGQRLVIVAGLVPVPAPAGSALLSTLPNPPAALALLLLQFFCLCAALWPSMSDLACVVSDCWPLAALLALIGCAALLPVSRRGLALARLCRALRPLGDSPRGALGSGVKPPALCAAASFAAALGRAEGSEACSQEGSGEGTALGAKRPAPVTSPGLARLRPLLGFLLLDFLFLGSGRGAANSTGNRSGRESGLNENGPALVGVGPSVSSSCRLCVGTADSAPLGASPST